MLKDKIAELAVVFEDLFKTSYKDEYFHQVGLI